MEQPNDFFDQKVELSLGGRVKVESFEELGLPELLATNVAKEGYSKPTPIQQYAMKSIQDGKDLMACSQTGSGKTAAFLLPIMSKLIQEDDLSTVSDDICMPRALILAPTRELAIQIHHAATKFSMGTMCKCEVLYGGTAVEYQKQRVLKGAPILVGTIGRLKHFIIDGIISLERVQYLIHLIGVDLRKHEQNKDLQIFQQKTIIFVSSKTMADCLGVFLSENKIPTTTIHGDREQEQRESALVDFRSGGTPILIATSVAERGLDISGPDYIINYDMPKEIDDYLHRIGRTGRVGKHGLSTSFIDAEQDGDIIEPLLLLLEEGAVSHSSASIGGGAGMRKRVSTRKRPAVKRSKREDGDEKKKDKAEKSSDSEEDIPQQHRPIQRVVPCVMCGLHLLVGGINMCVLVPCLDYCHLSCAYRFFWQLAHRQLPCLTNGHARPTFCAVMLTLTLLAVPGPMVLLAP